MIHSYQPADKESSLVRSGWFKRVIVAGWAEVYKGSEQGPRHQWWARCHHDQPHSPHTAGPGSGCCCRYIHTLRHDPRPPQTLYADNVLDMHHKNFCLPVPCRASSLNTRTVSEASPFLTKNIKISRITFWLCNMFWRYIWRYSYVSFKSLEDILYFLWRFLRNSFDKYLSILFKKNIQDTPYMVLRDSLLRNVDLSHNDFLSFFFLLLSG